MIESPLSIYCPHCHRHTSLTPAPVSVNYAGDSWKVGAFWRKSASEIWWIGICNYCNRPVLVMDNGEIIYPVESPCPTDENIPVEIRQDLDEAKRCLQTDAFRATAVMARRSIQACEIDKGAKKDKLAEQISELAASGVITKDVKEWADLVRWVGNDGAHPGGQPVTKEDAEEILNLAEQLLHVVYVTTAAAKAMKKARGK